MELTDEHIHTLAEAAEKGEALQHATSVALGEGVAQGTSYASLMSEEPGVPKRVEVLAQVHPKTLASLVGTLPQVKTLRLSQGLTDAHVEALIPLAEQGKLKTLTQLDLGNNPEITEPKGVLALAQALQQHSPAFKNLRLAGTGIEKNGWNLLLQDLPDLTLTR